MPGVITHLVCAERYLRQNPRCDFKKFILGTVFPDIRYIAHLGRDLTHKKFKPDLNLSRLDSFKAGWKFHIYIDHQWNEIFGKSRFYEQYSQGRGIASAAAKIIEDRLDYKKIDMIERYLKALRNPDLDLFLSLSIPGRKIKFYYSITLDYVITKNYKTFVRQIFGKEMKEMVDRIMP